MIRITSAADSSPRRVPADHSLATWSCDVSDASTLVAPTVAGRLEFARLRLSQAATVTNIIMHAASAGATLTSGQCFAALYTAAGALIGQSADQSTAWASGGIKTMALAGGPYSCTAGDYYAGFWYNGTTSPGWAASANLSVALVNLGLTSPNLRFGNANTGLTTTAPGTMGAQGTAAAAWWVALS